MDITEEIRTLKTQKLREVADSAATGDVPTVLSHTRIVETLEKLEKQLNEITTTFNALKRSTNRPDSDLIDTGLSHKQMGQIMREKFAEKIRDLGIKASQIRGVRYKIGNDKNAGIAYASERPGSPNKWWLGLPKEDFDVIVLLCKDEYEKVIDFIFPKEFYDVHKNSFSEDQNGQLKFNIMLRNGSYTMKLPGKRNIFINEYIGAIKNL
jgi:hypothetical protein